jgi:hypothetical protein
LFLATQAIAEDVKPEDFKKAGEAFNNMFAPGGPILECGDIKYWKSQDGVMRSTVIDTPVPMDWVNDELFMGGNRCLWKFVPPYKYTVRCGDIEAIVTVTPKFDDRGPFNKFDIYGDPKIITQYETEHDHLYLNGKACVPAKIWVCPHQATC